MNTHLTRPEPSALSPYLAPPALPPSDVQKGGLDAAQILALVKEWRWLILACTLIGVILALLATFLSTPLYRATTTLEANPPKVEVLSAEQRDFEPQQSTFDFIATQVGLIKSRTVAERTAQKLKLAGDATLVGTEGTLAQRTDAAAGIIQGGLSADIPDIGQIVTVSYVDTDPARAANIANGVAEALVETNMERRFGASKDARLFLERQIAKTRASLEDSERKLVGYQQAQGIINTARSADESADVSSLQGASLISLNEALAAATSQRVQAQSAYEQGRLAAQADATTSSSTLRTTLAGLEAEYQDKRTTLKPDHPEMVSLQSRMDELRRQIGREQSVAAGSKVAGLLAAYRAAQAAESRLRGQVAGLKGSVLDLRGRSIQYNILQREVDTNRSLYDALLQRYKQVGVGSGVEASPISVIDRAQPPVLPFKPSLQFNLLVGLIGGLLAGLGLAFLLEFLNDTIRTREDVRTKLDRACLGVVPKEKDSTMLVEDFKDPASSVSEAYSAIVAALRFSSEHGAPPIMAITSANASEGKSSSALAIASNYARRGEKVLLVDADLRRPVFRGLSNERGLTSLLAGETNLREQIVGTEIESLFLLPCGPIAPNPADLLSSGRFAEVLAEAKKSFDRIIVDGPPVAGMADASFIAAAVRNVLMVLESGKTRTKSAREAIERIEQTGAHLLGVALTKSTDEASRYGYGSYRYYRSIDDRSRSSIMIAQQDER